MFCPVHSWCVQFSEEENTNSFDATVTNRKLFSQKEERTIRRGKETGRWLNVLPSEVHGTTLSACEFRDSLNIRYAQEPPGLPKTCDGCQQPFSTIHGQDCKSGGRIIMRHNEIVAELKSLLHKSFPDSAVRDEPLIHPVSTARITESPQKKLTPVETIPHFNSNDGDRGDLLVRGLFGPSVETIIDVRVTNLDNKSQARRSPKSILKQHEQEKRDKYLAPCLEQRRSFIPFVVSTDGLLGYEASNLLKHISSRLAKKWNKQYSVIQGFVKARMTLAIIRASHQCLRSPRIPASKISYHVQWEDGAGLGGYPTKY